MSSKRAAAIALVAFLATTGCGKKGDPEPPILRVPAPTKDLAVVQRGDRLLVELGYPQTTAAGTPLGGLDALTVRTLVTPAPTGDPAAAPEIDDRQFTAGAEETLVLEGEDLTSAVRGDRIAFDLPLPAPPQEVEEAEGDAPSALTLAVTTRGPDGQVSALSNRITYPRVEPPEPPTGVEATGLAAGIRVRWSHPLIDVVRERLRAEAVAKSEEGGDAEVAEAAEAADEGEGGGEDESTEEDAGEASADEEGIPFAGFNVYRRLATERTWGPPIRTVGPRADNLLDSTARLGERYIYGVTAVASLRPVVVESDFAEEVEIGYLDRFPPPRPSGLVALTEGSQVRLVWEASEADDLAGYRIYRRSPDTQELRPVTDRPVASPGYTDRELAAGATYTYQVTAVDEEGNESAPSESVTAAIR
jgi:hypothetical protein